MKYHNLIYFILLILSPGLTIGCNSKTDEDNNIENSQSETSQGNEIVIYEINPKLYATDNAFDAIAERLDEIQELGVNVLWLMPIYELGEEKAIGSPYCIKNYMKHNAEYGDMEALCSLIDEAHSRGMRVIFDWIANHTSWDNVWMENPSWYTQDSSGNIISPEGMGWNDVADLNFESEDMCDAMVEAMIYWVKQTGIDGYRCDFAEGVPYEFWSRAIAELRALKGEELLMLAEGGDSDLFGCDFDILYGWDFAAKLKELFAGNITVAQLYDTHREETLNLSKGKVRLRYSTNHDMASEHSPLTSYGDERGAMAAFVIASMLDGVPLIYSSQEIGYSDRLTFFDYVIMDWDSNPDYYDEYVQLMSIYSATSHLRGGELYLYSTDNVASFYRKGIDGGLFVVVNPTNESQLIKTPIERSGDSVRNLLDGSLLSLPSIMTLEAYQYCIFEVL